MTKRNASSKKSAHQHVPAWEWAVAAVGALLVAGMLGFMAYRAMRGDGPEIPELQVEVREVHARGETFMVVIDVRNTGNGGGANVAIEGELVDGDNTLETASVTLDYVPAGSLREAGLIFNRDPARHQLRLRATGYQKP